MAELLMVVVLMVPMGAVMWRQESGCSNDGCSNTSNHENTGDNINTSEPESEGGC